MLGQPPQRGLHQRRRVLEPLVVLALAEETGEQVPDPRPGGPQPVVFVVVAQQHLGHGQTDQLGVGHHRWTARAAAACPMGGDDPVNQFHIECDEKGVQVGDHEGSRV